MTIRERVVLSSLTTFRIGGEARYVAECENVEDIQAACSFARTRGLSLYVLGEGSNVLAADEGYDGVVLRIHHDVIEQHDESDSVVITAGAGVHWDDLVQEVTGQSLWGFENLAGIPGTVGAAPVQNIGAYGAEVADTIAYVTVFNQSTGVVECMDASVCRFGYRESIFKQDPRFIILSVTFRLSRIAQPRISYKDLEAKRKEGRGLNTPREIAETVREIRAGKFPDLNEYGTAGSFFKNPTITAEAYDALQTIHPAFPGFPTEHGIKIPLAYVLDHLLDLRGFRMDRARLFETQPLVIVTDHGATTREVEALAHEVEARVKTLTGITIEREVRMLVS